MQNYQMSEVSFAIKASPRLILAALATTITLAALRPASAASAGPSQSSPEAAATAPDTDQEADQSLDEVVVEAVAPDAVVGDIPPENQLNPAQIAAYGDSTVNDLLNDVAQQTQSDQGQGNTAPIILVNGKRVSGVNEVGDLPTESVLRVDILPEEVALRYGYGAQQKVVNIILRRNFRAKLFDLTGSEPTEGGGESDMADANYSRIHNNDRVNVVARVQTQESILESDRGVSSTAGAVSDPTGSIGNDSDARTLEPATNTYSLNSVFAYKLSQALQGSFNARATYQTTQAKDGYPAANLDVPAGTPYALEDVDTMVDRYLSGATLHQDANTGAAHMGVTLNADLPARWRLSFIGIYDYSDALTETQRTYETTNLQTAINAGQVNPYGVLPLSLLGALGRQDADAISNTGSGSFLANGTLFKVRAGNVTSSLQFGANYSDLDARSIGRVSMSSARTQGTEQISVNYPLTSRLNHVLGFIGDTSVNVTVGLTQVSGYGDLSTIGYGLHWMPVSSLSFLATINQDHQVPTLTQLDGPLINTPNIRLYDYVLGQTDTVTQLSGGNPDLIADDRHVFKIGATWNAIDKPKTKLNFTASYLDSVTRNAIGSLTTATSAIEAAFPDQFERSEDDELIEVDDRAVNFSQESRHDLRWGFNFTKVLREPTRPRRFPGARPPAGFGPPNGFRQRQATGMQGRGNDQVHAQANAASTAQGGGQGNSESNGQTNAQRNTTCRPQGSGTATSPGNGEANAQGSGRCNAHNSTSQAGLAATTSSAQAIPTAPPDSNTLDEVEVDGSRNTDASPFGPPGARGGRFGGRGGGGARAGALSGRGPSGAGGFGRPGNRGGAGGGGFGSGNGAQLDVSLYHSWYFMDTVRLTPGSPQIDLLNGGSIGEGGQPRHQFQLNAGVIDNGIGYRVSGVWTSATAVLDSGNGEGPLYYSSLLTLDARLFVNLQQRFLGKRWARNARVTLALSNIFNKRQDIHGVAGEIPQIYQPPFLDPYGRTVGIEFRKLF
ncbi:MAG TPA: hypothetical protein VHY19_09900 [Steroidobacteraceae bacterium]|jgi:hypothetical protein|nr:hypothetical protein [Steroidobacteraceae bacterium]